MEARWIDLKKKTWCSSCKKSLLSKERAVYDSVSHMVYCGDCGVRETSDERKMCGTCGCSVDMQGKAYHECHKAGQRSKKVKYDQGACEHWVPRRKISDGKVES